MKYDTFMKLFSVCAAVAVAGAVWSGVRFAFSGEGTAEISSFTCPEIGFRFMLR